MLMAGKRIKNTGKLAIITLTLTQLFLIICGKNGAGKMATQIARKNTFALYIIDAIYRLAAVMS